MTYTIPTTLRCGQHTIEFGRVPRVMGVLNVTPDSFSDGGQFVGMKDAVSRAHEMAGEGAAIIDVGGESTRPGSAGVGKQEELDRVMPVIEALVNGDDAHGPLACPISIDTRKPRVAAAALAAGAHMVNDVTAAGAHMVSGAAGDPAMVDVLREVGESIPVVIMHMKGTPETMQDAPLYHDVVGEVREFLEMRAGALAASGISRERIVLDPGIGFGKRLPDNLELLKNIDVLRSLGYPLLVGASRKTFIGTLLDAAPDERLPGSLAVAARCYQAGIEVVRVHDVRETVEMMRVLDAIEHPGRHRTD